MASDPEIRLREMATLIGITERCAQQIVNDLEAMGVIRRSRTGRRNTYEIHREARFRHPLEADLTVGAFLDLVERERSAPLAISGGASDPSRAWRTGDAVRPTASVPSPFDYGVGDRSSDGAERGAPGPGTRVSAAGDGRSPYPVGEVPARGSGRSPYLVGEVPPRGGGRRRPLATESPISGRTSA